VEVFVLSALLESGMCLVDTPGIGSVFAGNTVSYMDLARAQGRLAAEGTVAVIYSAFGSGTIGYGPWP